MFLPNGSIELEMIGVVGDNVYYNFTSSISGRHNITLGCKDVVGNTNTTSSYINVTDSIYPIINITYPRNTTYNINVSNLNYTITELYPDSCWYSRNRGITNSSRVTAGINFTNVTSIEGSNNWTVYCNDTSNNINSTTITFHKDTVYPVLNIISPIASNYYSTDILFNISSTDTYGISNRWYNINNGLNVTFDGDELLSFSSDGSFYTVFWVNDTANNVISANVTFTKSNPPNSYGSGAADDYYEYVADLFANYTSNITFNDTIEDLEEKIQLEIESYKKEQVYEWSQSLLRFVHTRGMVILISLGFLAVFFLFFILFKKEKEKSKHLNT